MDSEEREALAKSIAQEIEKSHLTELIARAYFELQESEEMSKRLDQYFERHERATRRFEIFATLMLYVVLPVLSLGGFYVLLNE